jgi:N-acetyl-anhydromuramyl-L-alanine amidase AmpD
MRPLKEIIVHCSATRPNWMDGKSTSAKVREIKLWHTRDNKWSDIGYHFLIDRDGTLATGRPVERPGAHTMNRNAASIGVCLIGGFGSAATDRFEQNFTPEQDRALRALIADLQKRFGKLALSGHNQWAAKACPGFNVPAWHSKGK